MEYSQGGQTYLPVFSDQRTAESYSASLPPAPGEQRRIEAVDAAWLLACTARGYQPVLDAHLAERRLITETELRGVVPVPTNV